MIDKRYTSWLAIAFFAIFLGIGLTIYQDYGVSWDGPAQRKIGGSNVRYICEQTPICEPDDFLNQFPPLPKLKDRDYSPIHEIVLMTTEWQLGLTDPYDVYSMRHLLNFLFFFVGTIAFYRFVADATGDNLYGLVGAALLVLTPRIFAHAFFNTKDLAFLSGILICLYTMNRFLRNSTYKNAIVHGIATGIAIDLRIMGVVIVCCTLGAILVNTLKSFKTARERLPTGIAYLIVALATTVAFFPHLWKKPGANFVEIFEAMSHFRWLVNVKFMNELIPTNQLPWYYSPIWIGISTPISYLSLILAGAGIAIYTLLKQKFELWNNHQQMMTAICLALFLGPILTVILLDSVLYDGWRQLFFVYPAAIFLAVVAVKSIVAWGKNRGARTGTVIGATMAIIFLQNAYTMVDIHPHQNAYFNIFAGNQPSWSYDNDYWGISNKQALEAILAEDPSPKISVAGHNSGPMETASYMIPKTERKRLTIVRSDESPDYILTNYRYDNSGDHSQYKGYEDSRSIVIHKDRIATVFRRPNQN